jgi:hypothetical protein
LVLERVLEKKPLEWRPVILGNTCRFIFGIGAATLLQADAWAQRTDEYRVWSGLYNLPSAADPIAIFLPGKDPSVNRQYRP